MSRILGHLLGNEEHILPLIGLHGIGKSALARNTLHYAAERKMFTGGALLIQLKDMRSNFAMLKLITRATMKFLYLSKTEKIKLVEKTHS